MYYDTISVFKTFHKDFGSRIVHSFRVQNATALEENIIDEFEISIKQKAGKHKSIFWKGKKLTTLFNGKLLLQKNGMIRYISINNISNGIYFIKFMTSTTSRTRKNNF